MVIVREDLLEQKVFAPMLDYKLQADNASLYNTPPTYSIYIAKLVFEWLKEKGGVPAILEADRKKQPFFMKPLNTQPSFLVQLKERAVRSQIFLL